MDIHIQIEEIIQQKPVESMQVSQLGFFSKPVRLNNVRGRSHIVKLYRPIKSEAQCLAIIAQHDSYITALNKTGIHIPGSSMQLKKVEKKYQLVIIQDEFKEDELIRSRLEKCDQVYFVQILGMLLDDILQFWSNKDPGEVIGFHPTLRNYAIKDQQLYYFDTFPPMLMQQHELNRLIIKMAPVKLDIRFLIPAKAINIISDEYYQVDKMITGIIGSCCRLRPDLADDILGFSHQYISNASLLNDAEKYRVLKKIKTPPRLPGIWITFRKIFGAAGKHNIKNSKQEKYRREKMVT